MENTEFKEMFQQKWPYADSQSQQVQTMLNRLIGWRNLVESLDEYFRVAFFSELQYSENLKKSLASIQVPTGYAALTEAMHHMRQSHERRLAHHSKLANRLQNEVCSVLSKIRKDFGPDVASIIREIERLETNLRLLRQETLKGMITFEKAYWASEASMDHTSTDPWLSERMLKEKIQRLTAEETNYLKAMKGFFRELTKIDTFLSEGIQGVLAVYASCVLEQDQATPENSRNLISLVSQIQPVADFEEFLKKTHLDDLSLWNRDVEPLQYRFQNGPLSQVYLEGELMRRVGTLSYGWRPTIVVVTETAFLHCFELDANGVEDLQQPVISICLRQAEIQAPSSQFAVQAPNGGPQMPPSLLGNITSNTFEVISPKAWFASGTRFTFQARSTEEVEHWVKALTQKATEPAAPGEVEELNQEGNDDYVLLANRKEPSPERMSKEGAKIHPLPVKPNSQHQQQNSKELSHHHSIGRRSREARQAGNGNGNGNGDGSGSGNGIRMEEEHFEMEELPLPPPKKPNIRQGVPFRVEILVHDDEEGGPGIHSAISEDYSFVDMSH